MTRIYSFPPVADKHAKILLLGSMPGKASLRANQYYAHSRNAFWKIVASLFNFDATLPYSQRCEKLKLNGIALWDVLKTCTRTSSLDSDIDENSIVANDFAEFFAEHKYIETIYFNGMMAEKSFRKYVLPDMGEVISNIHMERLPSTSPAHASLGFEDKLKRWSVIRRCVESR